MSGCVAKRHTGSEATAAATSEKFEIVMVEERHGLAAFARKCGKRECMRYKEAGGGTIHLTSKWIVPKCFL
jgi:hypothetical protein